MHVKFYNKPKLLRSNFTAAFTFLYILFNFHVQRGYSLALDLFPNKFVGSLYHQIS